MAFLSPVLTCATDQAYEIRQLNLLKSMVQNSKQIALNAPHIH